MSTRWNVGLVVVSCVLFLAGPGRGQEASPRPGGWVQYFVATNGNDQWSGQRADPAPDGKDGPFATLERARDAVRSLEHVSRHDEGVVVFLRGGSYYRTQTFELEARDGGTSQRPVVYRSCPNELARLTGAQPVVGFSLLKDEALLARLEPQSRGQVWQADLKAQGIVNFGNLSARGFHRAIQSAPLEVFFRGKPMSLARWPKSGYATITATPYGHDAGRFTFENDRLARWVYAPDVWVHGYWTWNWADSWEKVSRITLPTHEILTDLPHGIYGYSAGRRFAAINCFDELSEPGEYYLDRQTGILYFWPPETMRDGDVTVSMLSAPFVEMHGASNVTLREIAFSESRDSGAIIVGGEHNRIAGCRFTGLGTFAVSIGDRFKNLTDDLYNLPDLNRNGGVDNAVVSCDISHTGEGGILLGGGDRATLTEAGNAAINNRITDFARWVRTYRPAIFVDGVGNHVAHNVISDGPHAGIVLKGNDHIIEFNQFDHVCNETADAGAFYMGRDFTERGNVVRFNLFRWIGGPNGFSNDINAIYLDDFASGTLVYGNIAYKCGRGILLGGGRDNIVDNNLFVDCNPAVFIDARGTTSMKNFFNGSDNLLFDRVNLFRVDQPPYGRRYPQLARLQSDQPALPKGNRFSHNIRLGGTWLGLGKNCPYGIFGMEQNFITGDPKIANPDAGDFRLADDSPTLGGGFKPIPVEKIGIQPDMYRRE